MTDIPCRCCGVATDQRVTWQPDPTTIGRAYGRKYEVGVCDECLALRPDEPGSAVRAALRVLGKDEADWRLAGEAFEDAGVDVSPIMYDSEVRPRPQRKPWAHVKDKDRLRKGYARFLDFRVHAATDHDRPVPETAPPTGRGGCTACGVAVSPTWRTVLVRLSGPSHTDEALCSACTVAYDETGAWGAPFLERSALAAKGFEWSPGLVALGLRPWAVLDLPPNREPWEHVSITPPEPELSPLDALQVLQLQVADLQREVAALAARLP